MHGKRFFRLHPIELRRRLWRDGMGRRPGLRTGRPDPLAETAPGILAHMNADHVDAMILLAGLHAGIEATEATMTSVDRLGFHSG